MEGELREAPGHRLLVEGEASGAAKGDGMVWSGASGVVQRKHRSTATTRPRRIAISVRNWTTLI